MPQTLQLFIHGEYVDATSGETFETLNPATGEVLAKIQVASEADVDRAVQSSKEAFADWSRRSGTERSRVLMRAVQILRDRNDELAQLESRDTGKALRESGAVDVVTGADCIEYLAGVAPTLHGHHYDLGKSFVYTRREALGVCGGIGAWNYPLQIACWKSGPALACGNAMVYKPSELTPLTALKLAEIFMEAGAPAGLFNVVQGAAATGQAISRHPEIAKISFTGEVGTGKKVMADAALSSLKYVTMELGGKSPLIIFEDADLDNAVRSCLAANFYTQGEICTNGTRVFVHSSVHAAFLAKMQARANALRIGDPLDPATQVGALISKEHTEKVLAYIEAGRNAGAKLICGGGRPEQLAGGMQNDCFVQPTIFSDCTDDMQIVREEIFGPVMAVLSFDTEDEVVRRANATRYGLAAGVFTKDLQRGHRVVAALEAGTCWINNYNITPIEIPIGGYKESGVGRENSPAAVEHYTQLKSVYVEMGDVDDPF